MTATDDKSVGNAKSNGDPFVGNHTNSSTNAQGDEEELPVVHGDDNGDKVNKTSKRSNIARNSETQSDPNPPLRRPRHNSKTSLASSTATSNTDVVVSSLAKRLTQMAVEERQNAMYDLHGLPREDEHPETIQKLLNEMDQSIERLQISKSSYAEGGDFGERDLFPLLTPEQQRQLLAPKEKPLMEENNLGGNLMEESDNVQTPPTQQRIENFGEGLRLARKQNPEYVHAQRIKFLRADRYHVNPASARMIRFFDIKRELFCDPNYNTSNTGDASDCLGRDLRLSDFSKEDLELWKKTGFIQLCGLRDRAKRPIIALFGKVILEADIPDALILRVYMYICNLWSRDESTQRAGLVAVAYNMLTGASPSRNPVSNNGARERNSGEEAIKKYLKKTSLVPEICKVGMSSQLRPVSMHFCIDHPVLRSQFEKAAGFMPTAAAARFRCHYASPKKPNTLSGNNESISSAEKSNNPFGNSERGTSTEHQTGQQEDMNETAFDSTINEHQEVLYTLMTFGIPKDSIPINDVTGEIQLDLHRATLSAIEEQENRDRSMEQAEGSLEPASTISSSTLGAVQSDDPTNAANVGKISSSLSSSSASNKLWMSLTASTGSNTSFALFPNLLREEELEDGSDESVTSLFGASPPLDPAIDMNIDGNIPDIASSFSSPILGESISNAPEESSPNPSDPVVVATANDVIMGRGPWNRNNAGNLRLKAMIEREREEYDCANRFERMRIVDGMLNELFDKFGSRFLYKAKADEPGGKDVWLVAKRDKAHDKITHDFRNLRRQKTTSTKSNPGVHNSKPTK